MKSNVIIIAIVSLLVGGGIGFFAGKYYQQSQRRSFVGQFSNGQFMRNSQGNSRGGFRPQLNPVTRGN